jgi:hypothetical protein
MPDNVPVILLLSARAPFQNEDDGVKKATAKQSVRFSGFA